MTKQSPHLFYGDTDTQNVADYRHTELFSNDKKVFTKK